MSSLNLERRINTLYEYPSKKVPNKTSFKELEFGSFVYGEVLKSGGSSILEFLEFSKKISNETVFYDLGSGLGKLVIHLGLKFPQVKGSIGIEYSKERYDASLQLYKNASAGLNNKNISLLNADFTTCDISDATIIFMDDTCHKCYNLFPIMRKKSYLPKSFTLVCPTSMFLFSRRCEDIGIEVSGEAAVLLVDQTYMSQRKFYIYNVNCK